MEKQLFSARIRHIFLSKDEGAETYSESILVFRAADFEAAFEHALLLGQERARSLDAGTFDDVRWRLKEIVSIARLQGDLDVGIEAYGYHEQIEPGGFYSFEHEFHPESSEPTLMDWPDLYAIEPRSETKERSDDG